MIEKKRIPMGRAKFVKQRCSNCSEYDKCSIDGFTIDLCVECEKLFFMNFLDDCIFESGKLVAEAIEELCMYGNKPILVLSGHRRIENRNEEY